MTHKQWKELVLLYAAAVKRYTLAYTLANVERTSGAHFDN